jgi:site-specific DNA recombinase
LETQKKLCEEFALKNSHAVMGVFGGTYESAKTDERKEFNRMLQFVKKSSEKISFIIISHIDRFSRTGANAIYIKEQLKIHHVWLQAATTPVDPKTSIGDFQQNVQFIFSHYDNQVRKERTIMGTKQALMNGHWCAKQPFGYDSIKISGQPRKIVVNETGRLLKKAFVWKATEQITHDEICVRLKKLGINIDHRRITDILRNPFYCGLITHNCLEGQIVEGKHEKLISKDLFLKVNNILNSNKYGYNCQPDADATPLRRFMKCDCCNASIRGYIVMKKKLHYYKCNTKGCRNNRSAQELDEIFERTLGRLTLDLNEEFSGLLANQMIADYNRINEEKSNEKEDIKRQMSEIENKLERLEERFVKEEITQELFNKYSEKYKVEKKDLEREALNSGNQVSNLEKCVKLIVGCVAKLGTAWRLMAYKEKMLFQNMIFPEGIFYNREKDQSRTTKINSVILYIARATGKWEEIKSGESKFLFDFPACVPSGSEKSNFSIEDFHKIIESSQRANSILKGALSEK